MADFEKNAFRKQVRKLPGFHGPRFASWMWPVKRGVKNTPKLYPAHIQFGHGGITVISPQYPDISHVIKGLPLKPADQHNRYSGRAICSQALRLHRPPLPLSTGPAESIPLNTGISCPGHLEYSFSGLRLLKLFP
jgi:hypothetical protein